MSFGASVLSFSLSDDLFFVTPTDRFTLEERSPFARSTKRHQTSQTSRGGDAVSESKASVLPPKQKLPDENLTFQQLLQRYPSMASQKQSRKMNS